MACRFHFGDPTYEYNAAAARMTGLMALRLANANVPEYSYASYDPAITGYLDRLQTQQQQQFGGQVIDLSGAYQQAAAWGDAASTLQQRTDDLLASGSGTAAHYDAVTARLIADERAMLAEQGMPTRPWLKNQVYATGIDNGYSVEYLPGITDALNAGNVAQAQAYADQLAASMQRAAAILQTPS